MIARMNEPTNPYRPSVAPPGEFVKTDVRLTRMIVKRLVKARRQQHPARFFSLQSPQTPSRRNARPGIPALPSRGRKARKTVWQHEQGDPAHRLPPIRPRIRPLPAIERRCAGTSGWVEEAVGPSCSSYVLYLFAIFLDLDLRSHLLVDRASIRAILPAVRIEQICTQKRQRRGKPRR